MNKTIQEILSMVVAQKESASIKKTTQRVELAVFRRAKKEDQTLTITTTEPVTHPS
jgi:hypothetical protein